MAEIDDWNVTAANNNSAPPDGAPENMDYSAVNNVIRECMAVMARFYKDLNGSLTTTGSADTYAVTLNSSPGAYFQGMWVAVEINVTNTGASTINVNSYGAKNIKRADGSDVLAGDLQAGQIYELRYDGAVFRVTGDLSTDVTLAGTPDYLTISNQVITRNQIDLTTDVTGVLPSANGGSQIKVGHTTMTAATGNQAVTGIGFQPTWIMAVNVMTASASEITTACGYYEDSTYYQRSRTAYNNGSTVAFWNAVDSTSLYNVYDSGAVNLARGTIASFDADGFTINKSFGQMVVDVFWIVGT